MSSVMPCTAITSGGMGCCGCTNDSKRATSRSPSLRSNATSQTREPLSGDKPVVSTSTQTSGNASNGVFSESISTVTLRPATTPPITPFHTTLQLV